MSKIATETEAKSIGKQGTAENGRMCTKARAIALGCKILGSYDSNQLVQYEHLEIAKSYNTIGLYNHSTNPDSTINKGAVAFYSVASDIDISISRPGSTHPTIVTIYSGDTRSLTGVKAGIGITKIDPLEDNEYIYIIDR